MPTISVDKYALFKELGRNYSREEFDDLCFDFGIELDDDTEGQEEPAQLKIEIPANRYDMLCFEGIAMNLRVFLEKQQCPRWQLKAPENGELQTVTIHKDTERIRPYFSCAILRGIKFDKARYESFIALQDKLHQNLARQRSLVAIGTHDLNTIQGPFTYEALPPDQIKFKPLNQSKEMTGTEMMAFYEKDKHLGKYLHIIRDSPVYPIIYDKNRNVLSMPPIINGDLSKIKLETTDVLIDITATDKTKVEIVNHILVAMFSVYCTEPFTVEPVKIVSEHNGESRQTPDLTPRPTQASASFINSVCGLSQSRDELCNLLAKMCYDAKPSPSDEDALDINVPITRADVLHQADVMEDAAIAYGFNKLPRHFPSTSSTVAAGLPMNKLSDIVRLEAAMCGWAEVMPLILCSHDENYASLNKSDDGKAVKLQNPKTAEYQIVRTSLIPGLLKTVRENRRHNLPMKTFEVSDVCFKDETLERKSRNERHFAACFYGKTSGFEQVHGLLDRIMLMLKSAFIKKEEGLKNPEVAGFSYWIEEVEDATYLPHHAAAVYVRAAGMTSRIGTLGMLHPTVLKAYELPFPGSTMELNIEVFL
ncbi:phenylalanyl-tRNA synthetase [Polychaeton citri CBS 116435]|uniref:phenylalanine--tRNA ligase n=1 Tax=Polychaeton citri CBS 116435 TaxID=1314669 RepID=A0A9P4QAS4_9PEZI|nr:phenylalanyl-tRNA synthetase [Polychaeton citri CBS 116435]